jgi:enoyl-CoA hydratase
MAVQLTYRETAAIVTLDRPQALNALSFAVIASFGAALDAPIHDGLKIEVDLSTLAFRTADAEEGMAAFEKKRKPEFRDA